MCKTHSDASRHHDTVRYFPKVRAHVLQANAQSVNDILQAANVADVVVTSSVDPRFNQ